MRRQQAEILGVIINQVMREEGLISRLMVVAPLSVLGVWRDEFERTVKRLAKIYVRIDSVERPSLRIRLVWMKLRITTGAPATITV